MSGTLIVLLFLLNFWSVAANTFICYQTLKTGEIDKCTNVLVKTENRKSHTTRRHIVPIITNSIATSSGQVSKTYQIEVSKKRLLYNNDKKSFAFIPFPIRERIEVY